ncbi:MAG TPA: S8 family serine peptidase, partial [Planctomycetaceae bacterium]|nr:S8 family serine peptidase [Planctomycetaceae bacterium]
MAPLQSQSGFLDEPQPDGSGDSVPVLPASATSVPRSVYQRYDGYYQAARQQGAPDEITETLRQASEAAGAELRAALNAEEAGHLLDEARQLEAAAPGGQAGDQRTQAGELQNEAERLRNQAAAGWKSIDPARLENAVAWAQQHAEQSSSTSLLFTVERTSTPLQQAADRVKEIKNRVAAIAESSTDENLAFTARSLEQEAAAFLAEAEFYTRALDLHEKSRRGEPLTEEETGTLTTVLIESSQRGNFTTLGSYLNFRIHTAYNQIDRVDRWAREQTGDFGGDREPLSNFITGAGFAIGARGDHFPSTGPGGGETNLLPSPASVLQATPLPAGAGPGVQPDVEQFLDAVQSATGTRPQITERDGQPVVVLESEPFNRPASGEPRTEEQWGLSRIGLTPERHARVVDQVVTPAESGILARRQRVLFHLDWLLHHRAERVDLERLSADLAEEPELPAGDRAVLAGRVRDLQQGLRRVSNVAGPSRLPARTAIAEANGRSAPVRQAGPAAGAPVVIAVIDSGVDLAHPELWGQLWRNLGETPGNGIDDDGNGFVDDVFGYNFVRDSSDITDDNGHGTFVAGILAARARRGGFQPPAAGSRPYGMAGVNPHARLMILKAANAEGRMTPLALCRAIHYAVNHGAHVIHMSLGVSPPGELETATIAWAREQGVLLVAPSGSNGHDTAKLAPACLPGVLTVGATTPDDERAPLSGWGSHLDLVAPGVDILSLRAAGTDFLATFAGSQTRIEDRGS